MWKIAVADTAEDHLTLLKDALKAYFQETHRVFSVTSLLGHPLKALNVPLPCQYLLFFT